MADSAWHLERVSADRLRLNGDLKFSVIMQVRAAMEKALAAQQGPVVVDLSGVARVDSSALSLWLCVLRIAEEGGFDMRAENVPSDLSSIAQLVGLENYLS